jgi:hypothetical protein
VADKKNHRPTRSAEARGCPSFSQAKGVSLREKKEEEKENSI